MRQMDVQPRNAVFGLLLTHQITPFSSNSVRAHASTFRHYPVQLYFSNILFLQNVYKISTICIRLNVIGRYLQSVQHVTSAE